jgi:hypothetical protein
MLQKDEVRMKTEVIPGGESRELQKWWNTRARIGRIQSIINPLSAGNELLHPAFNESLITRSRWMKSG